MGLENIGGIFDRTKVDQSVPVNPRETCPNCGNEHYERCGAVGFCPNELCPSNDDQDYGN
jgi:hypothetical protein